MLRIVGSLPAALEGRVDLLAPLASVSVTAWSCPMRR